MNAADFVEHGLYSYSYAAHRAVGLGLTNFMKTTYMTTLPKALKDSGLVPPVIQRVWQWLKDNGPHDVNAVSAAIRVPHNSVSSTLGILCHRNMVTRKKEMDPSRGQDRFVYTVPGRLKNYELLPMSEESKNRPKRGQSKEPPAVESKDVFTRVGQTEQTLDSIPPRSVLDSMNVREAHALYLELKAMFTGRD